MAHEMTFAMASPTSTDLSFTDACRRNLCKVKTLSFEKKSYEWNVVDKLEIVSATRSDKSRGKVVMKYSNVASHHLNNQGNIHGGALATWVDVVTSLSIWFVSNVFTVSVGIHVDYIGAVSADCDLVFDTRVDKVGNTISFATCQITTGDGKVIANATHTVARARL
jgi:acyl-coenzyme A thioesterase 13